MNRPEAPISRPFLVIQLRPEDETADNEFESICRYGGILPAEVSRLRVKKTGLPNLDLDDFSAIIVGGSPFDISTPLERKSAIQLKIEEGFAKLFDRIVARDFPFLGCCSGNGLLGSYCGAVISNKFSEAVGGVDIDLTEEGRVDPLLKGFTTTFRVLTGHKEACDTVPQNCVLLATSENCPVQMFRLKTNIYATQFHPEADAHGFEVRINIYKNHGYFPAESARSLIKAVQGESTPLAQEILKRFVQHYRS